MCVCVCVICAAEAVRPSWPARAFGYLLLHLAQTAWPLDIFGLPQIVLGLGLHFSCRRFKLTLLWLLVLVLLVLVLMLVTLIMPASCALLPALLAVCPNA